MSLIIFCVNVVFDPRDRLTADDCIGTAYMPISAISGQGDDGKHKFITCILWNVSHKGVNHDHLMATVDNKSSADTKMIIHDRYSPSNVSPCSIDSLILLREPNWMFYRCCVLRSIRGKSWNSMGENFSKTLWKSNFTVKFLKTSVRYCSFIAHVFKSIWKGVQPYLIIWLRLTQSAFWLATRADKMVPSCLFATARYISPKNSPKAKYKSVTDQACSVKWLVIGLVLFLQVWPWFHLCP